MKWINRLYIFFLGFILTITTGFGLATFYPEPQQPQFPSPPYSTPLPASCNSTPQEQASPACKAALQQQQDTYANQTKQERVYEQQLKDYQNANASYTRNAIFFGVVIGALFAIIGLGLIKISKLISNGLLLSGLLTAVLTRLVISLASLGASATGTNQTGGIGIAEFCILVILSIAVIVVGLFSLKEQTTK